MPQLFSNPLPPMPQLLASALTPRTARENATGRSVCLYPPQPTEGCIPLPTLRFLVRGLVSPKPHLSSEALAKDNPQAPRPRPLAALLTPFWRNPMIPNFLKILLPLCTQYLTSYGALSVSVSRAPTRPFSPYPPQPTEALSSVAGWSCKLQTSDFGLRTGVL